MYEIIFYSAETGSESTGTVSEWADVKQQVEWLFDHFGSEEDFTVYVEPCGLPWYCDTLELHRLNELPQSTPW